MRRLTALLCLSVLVAAAAGCTSVTPLRPTLAPCDADGPARPGQPRPCAQHAIERHAGFDLAFVELTDMGLFFDRRQMLEAVRLVTPRAGERVDVVLYVHGWKHSAEADDTDLAGFVEHIVPALARAEPGPTPRRTVAIYVGWRGAPTQLLRTLSFYDRKGAADHIARGSVRELLAQLRALRAGGAGRVTVTVIGHSFGGLILFNAISGSLLDALVADTRMAAAGPSPTPGPFDLAVLLNPAFEGIRFEPLFQAALEQSQRRALQGPLARNSRPLLVSITSRADWATGVAFPLGRSVNSLLQHEGRVAQDGPDAPRGDWIEKAGNREAVGHLARYRTHLLTAPAPGRLACRTAANALVPDGDGFALWSLYADREVIASHGDVFNPPLWSYLADLKRRWDAGGVACAE